jgi:hypothetical protein
VAPRAPWRTADPLYRGDDAEVVSVPDPTSRLSIVAHILYIGSYGRATPFTSTTESEAHAEHFAKDGAVWETQVATATAAGAKHWPKKALLENLRGFGKGKAKWTDKWEVAQAALNVARWSEHLLDWSGHDRARIEASVTTTFRKRTARKRARR